jgi:Lrp/AsnC family transcriptional regulator of ectoine degradation
MKNGDLKLDERDLRILTILQTEGRITKTELAERVNLSPTPCWSRLKRLEKLGLIEGYRAKIALKRFGLTMVFMEAELESHRAADFARFETEMKQIPEVTGCWAVGGGIDYLIQVMVKDVDAYQRLVDRLLEGGIGLKRYYTYVVTKAVARAAPQDDAHTMQRGDRNVIDRKAMRPQIERDEVAEQRLRRVIGDRDNRTRMRQIESRTEVRLDYRTVCRIGALGQQPQALGMDAQQRTARAVHHLAGSGTRGRAALRRNRCGQLGVGLRPAVILSQKAAGAQREIRRRCILSQGRCALRHGAVLLPDRGNAARPP